MGKLLFDESPLVVQPSLAKAIGLNEAIVLQQLNYWMQNPKVGKTIDGKKWVFNSLSDWKQNFPFWSDATIWRTLDTLEQANLIEKGNYNRMKRDRTLWYTIKWETVEILAALIEQERTAEPETEEVKNASSQDENSISSNCENASSQNEVTLPETTSETTPDIHTSPTPPPETVTPKQATYQKFVKALESRGAFASGKLWETYSNTYDKNPSNLAEREQAMLEKFAESGNPWRALDAYREWHPPKPVSAPGKKVDPPVWTPPSDAERQAYRDKIARLQQEERAAQQGASTWNQSAT